MNDIAQTKPICSTREASELLGISVHTAQLWVENGRLQAWKTPGGHRRILRSSVERLLAQNLGIIRTGTNKMLILLLDDKVRQRTSLASQLEKNFPQSRLIVSANAFEGMLKIGEQAPDVLVADFDIVSTDNFSMLEAVNRNSQRPGMLLIVLGNDNTWQKAALKHLPPGITLLRRQEEPEELLRLIRAYHLGWQNTPR